jgi:crotonobetainyl-CoA:carnitine CoA-transferase CaiB-like acyl-CoA transferase
MKQVAPDMGQHNAEIARTLGYLDEDIAALQADGVLFSK